MVKEQANRGKDTVHLTLVILVLFLSVKGRKRLITDPTIGWRTSLKKMPFFSRTEIDNYVEHTGKCLGFTGTKFVRTGLK